MIATIRTVVRQAGRVGRWSRRRYERWESRSRSRIAGWSVRRRWVTLVLVPTLAVCCGGTVVGVPVAWVLRMTVEAGRGSPSPDAAANEYLLALSSGTDEGLLAVLDDERQDELMDQWRAYRAQMQGTDPPPAALDFDGLTVGPVHDGRAEVTMDVLASWWSGATSYHSHRLPWRFETRDDDGWRVSVVHPPAWCGGYVRTETCH